MRYADRRDAGRLLGERLRERGLTGCVVLALPRGGVPVGYEVASALAAPLDVLLVRKLGVPQQPELGMGAIGEDDVTVLNGEIIQRLGLRVADIERVAGVERVELLRRAAVYRRGRAPLDVRARHAVVVDDGLATGFTARAAAGVLRARGAAAVTVAVPVGAPQSVRDLAGVAGDVVCLFAPNGFLGVGQWYDDFAQTRDDEVVALLDAARNRPPLAS